MSYLTRAETYKKRITFIANAAILATIVAILGFCCIGIYSVFISMPDHKKATKVLKLRTETLNTTIHMLQNTLSEERKRFAVANRWATLLDMICDTDEKIRFDMVNDYLIKEKGIYKKNEN